MAQLNTAQNGHIVTFGRSFREMDCGPWQRDPAIRYRRLAIEHFTGFHLIDRYAFQFIPNESEYGETKCTHGTARRQRRASK